MKKIIISLVSITMQLNCFAQISTDSYGNVQIKRTQSSSYTMLGIGSQYNNNEFSSYQMGAHSRVSTIGKYDVALFGYANPSSPSTTGRSFGVCGIAGDATSGYNYGVLGGITNTQRNGAGIFGTTLNHSGVYIAGIYAGYFDGATRVAGTLTANSVVTPSDYRLKDNIVPLADEGGSALSRVMDMNVISYNYKFPEEKNDTAQNILPDVLKAREAESQIRHYGLLAQELQTIYPNLVREGQDGFLGINYIELVPVLIRSIQEMQQEIDDLKNINASMQNSPSATTMNDAFSLNAELFQNNPNPFSEQSVIKFVLPDDAQNAFIYIFDMQGKMLKQVSVMPTQNSVTVNAYELQPGIYLYSLVVSGKEIATKRMIISK